MQKRLLICILLYLCLSLALVHAQAPYKFTFQGIAINDNLQVIQNASISVRVSIIQTQVLGPEVFQEIHSTQTDPNGLFTITVGSAGGDLSDIKWPYDAFFLKVDDQNDGKFHFIGMSQLLSMPYSLYSNEAGALRKDFPILQKDKMQQSADLPTVGNGPRLIWHPKKAAFRVGLTNGGWEDANIGQHSIAAGFDVQASGYGSLALGNGATSSGHNSVALGYAVDAQNQFAFSVGNGCVAYNTYSFALGNWASAHGEYSMSLGYHTVAKAPHSVAIGLYNNSFDQPDGGPNDRLFQIGNGSDLNNRTNAMTVLKNGNIGIGSTVVAPEFLLDLGSRMRIRNSGSTAGIYLDNSQHKPEGFMGMKTDKEIGFYLNGAWRFWIDDFGRAWTPLGQLGFAYSDKRLKNNIIPLKGSLAAISSIRGYRFNWIDEARGTDLQTGVIAQEVEKHFPELIHEDAAGFKTVNYVGLIPHLIESVRDLRNQTAEIEILRNEIFQLKALADKNSNQRPASRKSYAR